MTEKRSTAGSAHALRDAFTFSLRGLKTVAAFAPVPAIADDRIRKPVEHGTDRSTTNEPAAATGAEGDHRQAA